MGELSMHAKYKESYIDNRKAVFQDEVESDRTPDPQREKLIGEIDYVSILSPDNRVFIPAMKTLSELIDGGFPMTSVPDPVISKLIQMLSSESDEIVSQSLDCLRGLFNLKDDELQNYLSFGFLQPLYDIISYKKSPEIICSALESLKNVILEKPFTSAQIDARPIIQSSIFILRGLETSGIDESSMAQNPLVMSSFILLGVVLSSFECPDDLQNEITEIVDVYLNSPITCRVCAASHAISTIAYSQAATAAALFGAASIMDRLISLISSMHVGLLSNIFASINNISRKYTNVLGMVLASDNFISIRPQDDWTEELLSNYFKLILLLLQHIEDKREPESSDHLRLNQFYCQIAECAISFSTSEDSIFKVKTLAGLIVCSLISIQQSQIISFMIQEVPNLPQTILDFTQWGSDELVEGSLKSFLILLYYSKSFCPQILESISSDGVGAILSNFGANSPQKIQNLINQISSTVYSLPKAE